MCWGRYVLGSYTQVLERNTSADIIQGYWKSTQVLVLSDVQSRIAKSLQKLVQDACKISIELTERDWLRREVKYQNPQLLQPTKGPLPTVWKPMFKGCRTVTGYHIEGSSRQLLISSVWLHAKLNMASAVKLT